jgi:hypothetical protein
MTESAAYGCEREAEGAEGSIVHFSILDIGLMTDER